MKKTVSVVLTLILVSILSSSVFAQPQAKEKQLPSETEFSNAPLTNGEKQILIHKGGFNETDIERMPANVLRMIISENGKKLSNGVPKAYNVNSESKNGSGQIGTMALTGSDIQLFGTAVDMGTEYHTATKTNRKKIYLYGDFQWKKEPFWELTDKMSIGWPATNKWYLDTKDGKILGHRHEYCGLNGQLGWKCSTPSTTPSNFDLGQGVAGKFDLVGTYSSHKGSITQWVYTKSTNSGTSNVLFRYGHRTASGSASVSIFPSGLAITPSTATETLDYVITFSW